MAGNGCESTSGKNCRFLDAFVYEYSFDDGGMKVGTYAEDFAT